MEDPKQSFASCTYLTTITPKQSEYLAKSLDPGNHPTVSYFLGATSTDTLQPWTVHRTYYGDPSSPSSEAEADLAWRNLVYILHYSTEQPGLFYTETDMCMPFYQNKQLLSNMTSANDIMQQRIVDRFDFSNMGYTISGEKRVYSQFVIIADKELLIDGSGLLKYFFMGGDEIREVESTTGPILATHWWNFIVGLGTTIKTLQIRDGFEPDDEEANKEFKIDLTRESEDVLADVIRWIELKTDGEGRAIPEFSVEEAKEIAREGIKMIDEMYPDGFSC
ncbi:hypothetical protein H072_6554 [Dactylellina haptotyla CBS 200.50]|uniref:Uncharacterized protein n=1 Tax=Dactylellina haptotyla (strain CBS 200.50) TaxID=1284197 RepID=S8AET6_DACHA|nr:hypothetical protein H072_6554 [Dactylellina haptotyla CBS 200.50]